MNEVKIVITAENRTFQEIERIRKHIKGMTDDIDKASQSLPEKLGKQTGIKAGKALTEGFSFSLSALKDAPWEMKAAGVAVGAVFGVSILSGVAAVLSGAALAGAAIAGVAGGLRLAANDPEVQDAASDLGDKILAHLQVMSTEAGFVSQALSAIDELDQAWDRNAEHVKRALVASAAFVKPLTEGLTGFADRVIPALADAVERAGPVVRVLRRGLIETGDAVASLLDNLTKNADEGAAAMQMVFDIVNATVVAVGALTEKGTRFYHTLLDWGSAISGFEEDIPFVLPWFRKSLELTNDEFERLQEIANGGGGLVGFSRGIAGTAGEVHDMAESAKGAARELEKLNQEFADLFDQMMSVEDANLAVKLGFIELRKEIKDNGRTLDEHTEAGIRNKQAINDQIEALESQRQAAIEAGHGTKEATDAANGAYVAGIESLRRMLKELGLLTPAMQDYLNKWIALATPKVIPVTVRVNVVETGARITGRAGYAIASGGMAPTEVPGAASGMMLGAGPLTRVGEHGEELVRLPPGAQVYNHGTTRRIDAAANGAGGSGSPLRIEVSPAPGFSNDFADEIIQQLRFRIRHEAGGSPDQFFNAYSAG